MLDVPLIYRFDIALVLPCLSHPLKRVCAGDRSPYDSLDFPFFRCFPSAALLPIFVLWHVHLLPAGAGCSVLS